jgi:hypothetical protein
VNVEVTSSDYPTLEKKQRDENNHSTKRSQSESPLKHVSQQMDQQQAKSAAAAANSNLYSSPPLSSSSSPLSTRSPKNNTPSPSHAAKCKILTTKFDKPVACGSSSLTGKDFNSVAASSSLVANAESALNSIINSLNQIDYSHLGAAPQQQQQQQQPTSNVGSLTKAASFRENGLNELKSENDMMKAMVSVFFFFYFCYRV